MRHCHGILCFFMVENEQNGIASTITALTNSLTLNHPLFLCVPKDHDCDYISPRPAPMSPCLYNNLLHPAVDSR